MVQELSKQALRFRAKFRRGLAAGQPVEGAFLYIPARKPSPTAPSYGRGVRSRSQAYSAVAKTRMIPTSYRSGCGTICHGVSSVLTQSIFPLRLLLAAVDTLLSTSTGLARPGTRSRSLLACATSASILYLYVSTKSSSGETAAYKLANSPSSRSAAAPGLARTVPNSCAAL